jgi:FKBP-type peptidyl-prolyl cis-trans isomerase (trigger factor)
VPQELVGQEIEIEFISTLAQAMKAQNIASMERFSTFVANLAQAIDPALVKKIKGEKMIDDYADFANIDPQQVASEEELAAYRQMMNEKQQQQEQMAALTQGSQLIKNMGGVDAFGGELMQRVGM